MNTSNAWRTFALPLNSTNPEGDAGEKAIEAFSMRHGLSFAEHAVLLAVVEGWPLNHDRTKKTFGVSPAGLKRRISIKCGKSIREVTEEATAIWRAALGYVWPPASRKGKRATRTSRSASSVHAA